MLLPFCTKSRLYVKLGISREYYECLSNCQIAPGCKYINIAMMAVYRDTPYKYGGHDAVPE